MTRLFYNLVHNAYRYSDVGGRVTITLMQTPDSVEIGIKNTGIGILPGRPAYKNAVTV
ncbi:Two-component sensor histidine kinase [Desulfosporosinus sp. I2]|nr:Two-component sensor histidine kinase [Desulfosporosinus sp. I2]